MHKASEDVAKRQLNKIEKLPTLSQECMSVFIIDVLAVMDLALLNRATAMAGE